MEIRSISLNDKSFRELLKLIHELTGITISSNRKSMVEGRLRKRVTSLSLHDYESYISLVRRDKAEQGVFIDLVTTNETYFFRTPRVWDYIEKKLLPSWIKDHPDRVFTAWSAAASSGEEAHSLGVLCQNFKMRNPAFSYRILGTDISQEMVALCQEGAYSGRSIEGFKSSRPELFESSMRSIDGTRYQAISEIRSRLSFQQHNLFRTLSFKDPFDLVLLRNVLIYFKAADQEEVLKKIYPKIADDGVLIIGESESLSHIKSDYRQEEPLIYRKRVDALTSGEAA